MKNDLLFLKEVETFLKKAQMEVEELDDKDFYPSLDEGVEKENGNKTISESMGGQKDLKPTHDLVDGEQISVEEPLENDYEWSTPDEGMTVPEVLRRRSDLEVIRELEKIASELDAMGKYADADSIDLAIQKIAQKTYVDGSGMTWTYVGSPSFNQNIDKWQDSNGKILQVMKGEKPGQSDFKGLSVDDKGALIMTNKPTEQSGAKPASENSKQPAESNSGSSPWGWANRLADAIMGNTSTPNNEVKPTNDVSLKEDDDIRLKED